MPTRAGRIQVDLTSGEVAQILHVSSQAVSRAMDAGLIPSYRIPGTGPTRPGPRRVRRSKLLEWMQAQPGYEWAIAAWREREREKNR